MVSECDRTTPKQRSGFSRVTQYGGGTVGAVNLGIMYRDGLGVPQNYSEAFKWFLKVADDPLYKILGDRPSDIINYDGRRVPQNIGQAVAYARYSLANMYRDGKGVEQDYVEALNWYQKAADQGLALAQYNLGQMYRDSKGVQQNYAETLKWFHLAAEHGQADAQYSLGVMYRAGQGMPQNYDKARKWCWLAADQGNAWAQTSLGWMYARGEGVPQNYAEALEWFRKAADQGFAVAQNILSEMCARQTAKACRGIMPMR
jgi:TPR repeat protein